MLIYILVSTPAIADDNPVTTSYLRTFGRPALPGSSNVRLGPYPDTTTNPVSGY
jgi:hypothetical protein